MYDCPGAQALQATTLMFDSALFLQARGWLRDAFAGLAKVAIESGAFPVSDMSQATAKASSIADQAVAMVEAELCLRGRTSACAARTYLPWDQLSTLHLEQIRQARASVGTAGFEQQIASLSNTTFLDGNSVELLIDGPASFAVRKQLIETAQRSIWLMSWAMQEDNTGVDTAKLLIAARDRGVDVRVMVDGQVASRTGYDGTRALRDAGIPVVLWRHPVRVGQGIHMKAMIIDGDTVVGGGMNIGDVYSHHPVSTKPKWRDTDLKVKGPVAAQAAQVFALLWGQGLQAPDPSAVAHAGTVRMAFTAQIPDEAYIQLAILKAIDSATSTIDIENAYFISTPALENVLLAALARGVQVRILTNSSESIDEPIVTRPILASLPVLKAAGAQVFLKRGATLHSKFMVIDGRYTWIGSYNLHPRSLRYEGENIFQIPNDVNVATQLLAAFQSDLLAAQRVMSPSEIIIPESSLGILAERYLFDQL